MQDSDGFDKDGWLSYKGRYVIDKHGVWAKPVESKKEEVKEMYAIVHEKGFLSSIIYNNIDDIKFLIEKDKGLKAYKLTPIE